MKILILCAKPEALVGDGMINTLSTIYAFQLVKRFKHEITLADAYAVPSDILKLDHHDFCICTVNRGFYSMNQELLNAVKQKASWLITLCGSNKFVGPEDALMFTMGKRKTKCIRSYWGADFDLLKPEKPSVFTVLVDHKYYGKASSAITQKDKTDEIIKSLLTYKERGGDVVIRHIGTGKVDTIESQEQLVEGFVKGACMDFRAIYKYYNEAHVYVVTHPECFGLSVIECAATGGLIVTPPDYIKHDILKKIHHAHYTSDINWDQIKSMVDVDRSIAMAKLFSYDNLSTSIEQFMNQKVLTEV